MPFSATSALRRTSPVHACDARVKLLLTCAYSVALFATASVPGMALCALLLGAAVAASRLPATMLARLLLPAYVLAAFALLANGFAAASAGWLTGALIAARILLLTAASLVLTLSTASAALMGALRWLLAPLRLLRVPVDDVATTLSLAVRFIPLAADELSRVRAAQLARCAPFATGGVWRRLRAWSGVFAPLFVGLFRRADALSLAMDARCYGAPGVRRTALDEPRWTWRETAVLAIGLLACIACVAL
ncbi:energy-coupling factor transporter transmembrane protein EcfT [Eggerthellaceae bacterium zg-887]|nr:energy-coupling factor transporter transmembrane protein EcfT [Eggerthellaceae bacterium zg-893]NHM16738.1 energy-coupling factor transporter transmembrane protein EcfT [Xiamenia xianingshaonis]